MNPYRSIIKSTSILGGLQVVQILVGILRTKLIAVLMGVYGVGLLGLFTSTVGFLTGLFSMGINLSAVKFIVSSRQSELSDTDLNSVVYTLRLIMLFLGFIGLIFTLLLSNQISLLTFKTANFSFHFILLSLFVFFNQLLIGENSIIQAFQNYKYLAKSSVIGSFLGLIITIPLYYIFKKDGIVYGIIVSSFIMLLSGTFFSNKIFPIFRTSKSLFSLPIAMKVIKMGFFVGLNGLMVLLVSYLIRVYIQSSGGIIMVGYFSAGFAIVTNYVGMVFTAMGTDFYPRLASVSTDNLLCKKLINQQAEIATIILGPILSIFIIFSKKLIAILYSSDFILIDKMMYLCALGILFKAASWAMSYVILAKGESKLFFLSETLANVYMLVLSIIGYALFGLDGLGWAFLIAYIIYTLHVFFLIRIKFLFSFEFDFYKLFFFHLLCLTLLVFLNFNYNNSLTFFFSIMILFVNFFGSFKQLDKRIGIKKFLLGFIS